ncbi:MAG: hypothetical protein NXI31_12015 [bacterium]|nr:hypothetical protein [bacterium]
MTATLQSRRKRSLLAATFADPYRKLAAIALALGLWYFLNAQITRTAKVDLDLVLEAGINKLHVDLGDPKVLGTGFSADGKPIQSVQITFTGQSAAVDFVEAGDFGLRVDFANISEWGDRPYVEFEAVDLLVPTRLRGLELAMEPPLVRVHVDLEVEYRLPLDLEHHIELQFDDEAVKDRLQLETAKFEPDTVLVTGPSRVIAEFKRAVENRQTPFLATISASPNDRRLSAPIRIPSTWQQRGLNFAGASLNLRAEPETERRVLNVPLYIDHSSLPESQRGTFKPKDPSETRQVTIKAGGAVLRALVGPRTQGAEALDQWARENLRLIVMLLPADTLTDTPTREATLVLLGPLRNQAEASDYALAEDVPVQLVRTP